MPSFKLCAANGPFRAVAAAALLMAATWAGAAPVTVGNAAIDRVNFDGFSNFVIALPGASFSAAGSFDQWNVFVSRPGSLGLLVLNGASNAPTVVHSLLQTGLSNGLNTFTLGSALSVSAGDYLGIWMGDSKVDFDLVGANTPYSPNTLYGAIPLVGSVLNTPSSQGPTNRTYSINVRFSETTATVSSPGTLALVGLSLVGLGLLRRRA